DGHAADRAVEERDSPQVGDANIGFAGAQDTGEGRRHHGGAPLYGVVEFHVRGKARGVERVDLSLPTLRERWRCGEGRAGPRVYSVRRERRKVNLIEISGGWIEF